MSSGDHPNASEWVRAPQQARSEATMLRFLDSTAELLGERPFADISVNDIVERAGRTVGSFYARFEDKTAVLRVLAGQVSSGLCDDANGFWVIDRWRERSIDDLLDSSVDAVVNAYRQAGPVFHAAAIAAPGDEGFRQARLSVWLVCADRFAEVLADHGAEIEHPDPVRAGQLAMTTMIGIADIRLIYGPEVRPVHQSDGDLVDDLAEVVRGIIRPRR